MSTHNQTLNIDQLLRDIVLIVVQLKAKADITSGHKLYQLCKEQINTLRDTLYQAHYSQDIIDDISYGVCALLDETVLLYQRDNSKRQDYDEWLGAPLQVVFFRTNSAGHDLFEKIRARIKADKKEPLVLTCFDRILGLGFQGSYLNQPQMEREHLILALREAVRTYESEESHPLVQQTHVYRYFGRKTVLLGSTLLSIAAVIVVYFVLEQRLTQLIQPLIG